MAVVVRFVQDNTAGVGSSASYKPLMEWPRATHQSGRILLVYQKNSSPSEELPFFFFIFFYTPIIFFLS